VSVDESGVGEDRAVVDRIVDGRTAVLLVGPDEVERLLPVDALPDAAGEGSWVVLDASSEPPIVLRIDEQLTRERLEDLSARLATIRRERRGGRFGR
jgi:hypothetical protein